MKLRVLVNPKAGSGAAEKKLGSIERELSRRGIEHDVARTRRPGEMGDLVRQAHAAGVDCVAVVGGDGSLNEAAQAYVDENGKPLAGPDLALFPAGTGGDFRKTFGIGDSVADAVGRLCDAKPRPLDLGLLEATSDSGKRVTRAFINITSFGIGGLTDRIVNRSPKWMGGKAAFFVGTLRALMVYENAPVRVRIDGETWLEGPIVNVAIANGRYFGGGMKIAPKADASDGLFDVVALGDLGRAESVALSSKIYRGTHVSAPKVSVTRARRVEAEPLRAADEVLIDMDGETPGRLPLVATVLPGTLRIRA